MPKRRRFANREELLELLAVREPEVDWPAALDALEEAGALVQVVIEVDEEMPWPTSS